MDMTAKGNCFFMTYCCMKTALNMVVAKFAVEQKRESIILLALSPGLVDTSSDKHVASASRLSLVLLTKRDADLCSDPRANAEIRHPSESSPSRES
jgi:NAD(P)-dependent dehydrogenase (short-subunit alcohol dehydrogenase family)